MIDSLHTNVINTERPGKLQGFDTPLPQIELSGESLSLRAAPLDLRHLIRETLQPLQWSDRAEIESALRRHPQRTSEMTFVNLYAWAPIQYQRWGKIDDHIVVQYDPGSTGDSNTFLPPIGPNPVAAMEALHRKCGAVFPRTDIAHQQLLPSDILSVETPHDHDYLYTPTQIRELNGKEASELRRRLRKFNALSEAVSTAEISGTNIDDARAVVDKWVTERIATSGDEGKRDDALACTRILDRWTELPQLRGTIVYYKNEPVSLSIGEMVAQPETPGGTFVVHFEKSVISKELEGLPVYSFQRLCDGLPDNCVVNRMQTTGSEGLRRWKESWGPFAKGLKCVVGTTEYPKAIL